jgi:hypothetical protein
VSPGRRRGGKEMSQYVVIRIDYEVDGYFKGDITKEIMKLIPGVIFPESGDEWAIIVNGIEEEKK